MPDENSNNFVLQLLVKARAKIQERKQKKLDRVMQLLNEKALRDPQGEGKITNDDVEKLLRVSHATAFRYLDILEKQGKIKQIGKTGKAVFYVPRS